MSESAQKTLRQCERCDNLTIYAAEELKGLVPSGSTFGYDVVIFVGKALFLRHRRADEIVEELPSACEWLPSNWS